MKLSDPGGLKKVNTLKAGILPIKFVSEETPIILATFSLCTIHFFTNVRSIYYMATMYKTLDFMLEIQK